MTWTRACWQEPGCGGGPVATTEGQRAERRGGRARMGCSTWRGDYTSGFALAVCVTGCRPSPGGHVYGVEGSRPQPLTQASALKKTQNLGKPAQLHTVTISTDYCDP